MKQLSELVPRPGSRRVQGAAQPPMLPSL